MHLHWGDTDFSFEAIYKSALKKHVYNKHVNNYYILPISIMSHIIHQQSRHTCYIIPGHHSRGVIAYLSLKWQTIIQYTRNICITFVQCWTNVEDVGPTLYKCYTNVLCLLGSPFSSNGGWTTSLRQFWRSMWNKPDECINNVYYYCLTATKCRPWRLYHAILGLNI